MKQRKPVRPRWTRQEVAILRKIYKSHSNLEIAILLERSIAQITFKAYRLGISKGARRLSAMGRENITKRWQKRSKAA
jgi:hypothetical protein